MTNNDSGLWTLASQGAITFLGNILEKILGFAFVALATRIVSPSEYGIFTLGLSIVLFAQGFASLNIYRSIDYFVPQYLNESKYGRAKRTLQNAFLIGIISSIIGALFLFIIRGNLASLFDEPKLIAILPFLVILIPLQTLFRSLLASFNSLKKMKYRFLMRDLLNPGIRIIGTLTLVVTGAGLFSLIGGYLLGIFLAVGCGLLFLIKEADWIRNAKQKPISNRLLLSYSLPLVLAGIIYSLVGQVDYFFIGYFLGSADVGQYRVSYLLAGNLLIVISAISPVFKPMVAENQSDVQLLEDRYQLATRWTTILTLPLALTLILVPDIYLSLLFTDEYSLASAAVIALGVGYLLNSSFGPEGMVLEGLGYTRLTLLNTFILVSLNGLLNLLLVPRIGILGAGIATGTAIAISALIGVMEIYFLYSIHPFSKRLLRVWVSAVPAIVLGFAFSSLQVGDLVTAFSLPPIVFGTFFIALRFGGAFSDADLEVASRIDTKFGYSFVEPLISNREDCDTIFTPKE